MRNFEISLVVPFLLTIGGCSHNQRYYLDKGNVFFTERKYADAVLNYKNGIKGDPTSAEAFSGVGVAKQKVGDTQQAYQALHKAVELAPARDPFRVELAEMVLESYQRDRRKPKVLYDQLADNAEYLLRKNANSFDGLRLRAAVLSIDGKFQEALLALRRANEVQPLDPKAVYPMVQVLFLQNQAEAAVQLGKQLIEAHKDFSPIYDVLAIYLSRNNRMGEAEALLNSRVANIPNDPSARLQLASFYLKLQQEPMVQQALQGILNKPKDFPLGHQIVGDFFANHARLDEAVREYREGSRSDSKSQVTYQKRIAKALISQGKRDDAIEELNQLVKVSPEDWDSRLARAILLRETGDPKKLEFARAELNALVAKIPGDEVAQYNLGLVYVAQGDNKSAHVRLQESARLRREYLPPRLALAEMAQKA